MLITKSNNVDKFEGLRSKEEKIKKLFNKFSLFYENHMEETNHIKAQMKLLAPLYPMIKGRVLDVATGTGVVARLIAKNSTAQVSGIDFSESMIKIAKERAERESLKIEFIESAASNAPYPNVYFDVLTCSYGMCWFIRKKHVVEEIRRILKKGGLVILIEEDFKGSSKPVFSKLAPYLEELACLEEYVSIEEVKEMMVMAGFNLILEKKCRNDSRHDSVSLVFNSNK